MRRRVGVFQFQTGSIKSLYGDGDKFQHAPMFQFQTGSIKSKFVCWHSWGLSMFQFQTGSIKSEVFQPLHVDALSVSIPNWFD